MAPDPAPTRAGVPPKRPRGRPPLGIREEVLCAIEAHHRVAAALRERGIVVDPEPTLADLDRFLGADRSATVRSLRSGRLLCRHVVRLTGLGVRALYAVERDRRGRHAA